MPITLLLMNLAATWFMVGLIWFVQIAHYPQFGRISPDCFCDYHSKHTSLTTWVVGPPMLVEAATAIALIFRHPAAIPDFYFWLGAALVAILWLSTAFLQVPRHNRLAKRFDAADIRALCATNWLRTVAWTLRGGLTLAAVAKCVK